MRECNLPAASLNTQTLGCNSGPGSIIIGNILPVFGLIILYKILTTLLRVLIRKMQYTIIIVMMHATASLDYIHNTHNCKYTDYTNNIK